IAAGFSGLPLGMLVFLSVVLVGAFAVEAAVYPFHGWVPESYASTFTSLTSYLSGISTRMGVYGIILVVFGFIGSASMERMNPMGVLNFRYLFAVLSVLTMIVPTYTALFQHDAKRLVTWHGIGQGGYMLVGIISGTVLGIAGGLFHIFNHLTYVTLILFSLAAVEYRTGTMNLNKLGGLIKKQPVAFLGLLFGIIGLAGIPPMNGFVSKWFIYKGLIDNGMPFLALAAVIGTLGTILSVYKLIHNVFLGQLPEKYNQVREVPLFMQLPIWILMLTVFGTGVFPGPVLAVVAEIQEFFGQAAVPYSMTGIAPEAGSLNMFVINLVFMGSLAAAWLVYLAGGRRKHVGQYDNYAAGHFLDASVPYNFNYRFYTGFEHILKPENKRFAARFEGFFSGLTEFAGDYLRKLYSGNVSTYTKYILLSVVILVLVLGAMI
ncbi:MAG: hypothetical protein K9L68_12590, partial [Spirochaetales bacterium]|nr:hypothetical protein [Spirochaetales bacterium]MCF7939429.1 hypothetical protein [Spirochaetales bacterium]